MNLSCMRGWNSSILANSMKQSPSWESNSYSHNQEISHLLWNLRFIAMFTRPSHWTLSWNRYIQSTFSHSISLRSIIILSLHVFPMCATCPFHPLWSDHPNNIWWRVQIMKFLLMQFLHPPVTSSLLCPNILLGTMFSYTLNVHSLRSRDQISHPYK